MLNAEKGSPTPPYGLFSYTYGLKSTSSPVLFTGLVLTSCECT